MKIRSDFVTNSSSSSFIVNISIEDVDGNIYTATSDPDNLIDEGCFDHDLNCTAEDLMNVSSVQELANLLADSMKDNREYDMDDYEDDEDPREYALKEVKGLKNTLIEKIEDLSQIKSLKLSRIWSAWGECGSCWGLDKYNVPFCDLYELAHVFLDADGEEKETAKEELKKFASDDPITNDCWDKFPSGFLGSKGKWHLDWSLLTDDVEEFAKIVVHLDLPHGDYAEEITEIDMQNHIIKQQANYIPGGPAGEDEDEDWQ